MDTFNQNLNAKLKRLSYIIPTKMSISLIILVFCTPIEMDDIILVVLLFSIMMYVYHSTSITNCSTSLCTSCLCNRIILFIYYYLQQASMTIYLFKEVRQISSKNISFTDNNLKLKNKNCIMIFI